ncbi:MAG: hypothetical protein DLM72_21135 [Candidatus Nitrosopolaris wilkensis]|nr:MAG: hypothetical protein DLM72_21135 [Candidatus Nitrosopolaris wilkensis]
MFVTFPVVICLVISATTSSAIAQSSNSKIVPSVYPLDSKPYGLSYGQWTAKWWQWTLSIPKHVNPGGDTTGKDCTLKQSGPVWFLSGTFGGSATRVCTIPSGKPILLPLINAECDYKAKPNLKTESQLLACGKSENEGITGLDATIDGVKTQGLSNFRVQSPLFNMTYIPNNINGAPTGTTQGISDGYWVMLKPLLVGDHIIHIAGSVVNYAEGTLNNFANEVTYHIKVQ